MTTLALSSTSSLNRPNAHIVPSFSSSDAVNVYSPAKSSCFPAPCAVSIGCGRRIAITSSRPQAKVTAQRRRRMISCEVALKSDSEISVNEASAASVSLEGGDDEELNRAVGKIGARVRVKVPLKVFHVPKVAEVDLTGMEGVLKQYVGLWKGKRISANFPFKVEFRTEIEGRGFVKFFAHLKEEEFEYLD